MIELREHHYYLCLFFVAWPRDVDLHGAIWRPDPCFHPCCAHDTNPAHEHWTLRYRFRYPKGAVYKGKVLLEDTRSWHQAYLHASEEAALDGCHSFVNEISQKPSPHGGTAAHTSIIEVRGNNFRAMDLLVSRPYANVRAAAPFGDASIPMDAPPFPDPASDGMFDWTTDDLATAAALIEAHVKDGSMERFLDGPPVELQMTDGNVREVRPEYLIRVLSDFAAAQRGGAA